MLITACMKWLIEGVLDQALIEVVLLTAGIAFIVLKKGLRLNVIAMPWLLYIINIVMSLLINGSTFGLWGRALVTILITTFVFFVDAPLEKYWLIMKWVLGLGCLTAGMIFIHFLMGAGFNQLYFPLLSETAREMANLYSRYGYYFGLLYNPHEPAGLVSFAIAAIIIWKQLSGTRRKKWLYAVVGVLAVALLLTGKKAIFVCMILTLTLTVLILYGSRKQVLRGIAFLLGLIVLVVLFVVIALRYPEIGVFARFSEFLQQIAMGQDIDDSGRFALYVHAIAEWEENKLFGIGWRHFNKLTTTKFNMYRSHEVNCDYLQWLCETGIVGFMLSMIPVAIMAYRTMFVARKMIRRARNRRAQWIMLMAVHIQVFTLIYAFVEIPFFDIVYYSIYIISCIVINSAYSRRRPIYEQRR